MLIFFPNWSPFMQQAFSKMPLERIFSKSSTVHHYVDTERFTHWESFTGVSGSRWQHQILSLPPRTQTQNLQLHTEEFPLKDIQEIAEWVLKHWRTKKAHIQRIGDVENKPNGFQGSWEVGTGIYTLLYIKQIIRTYHIAQGILLSTLEWPMWEKYLKPI